MPHALPCRLAVLVSLALASVAGCAVRPPAVQHHPALMLVLRVPGGGRPTPQQVAAAHRALADTMAREGLVFAQRLDQAEYLMTATLTPDPVNPAGGRLSIDRLERVRPPGSNPRMPPPPDSPSIRQSDFEQKQARERSGGYNPSGS